MGTAGAPAGASLAEGIHRSVVLRPAAQSSKGSSPIEARYPGLEDFNGPLAGLSPKEFKEQLRWFARDVMPRSRDTPTGISPRAQGPRMCFLFPSLVPVVL